MQPQKLTPTTEVGCGLQKYSTFSEKRAKILTIFFFIFLIFFGNFDETERGKAKVVKQSIVERG
jgi:preprotein translocase subunit SecG